MISESVKSHQTTFPLSPSLPIKTLKGDNGLLVGPFADSNAELENKIVWSEPVSLQGRGQKQIKAYVKESPAYCLM